MSHVTHVNESWHTCKWIMSHMWMSPVTHMNTYMNELATFRTVIVLVVCVGSRTQVICLCVCTALNSYVTNSINWDSTLHAMWFVWALVYRSGVCVYVLVLTHMSRTLHVCSCVYVLVLTHMSRTLSIKTALGTPCGLCGLLYTGHDVFVCM